MYLRIRTRKKNFYLFIKNDKIKIIGGKNMNKKNYTDVFKIKLIGEVVREEKTLIDISSE